MGHTRNCENPFAAHQDVTPAGVYCASATAVIQLSMKTLTVRLPDSLVRQIEVEPRDRGVSKIRRHARAAGPRRTRDQALPASYLAIADLIGSVKSGPPDRSRRVKHYLKSTGYGRNRAR